MRKQACQLPLLDPQVARGLGHIDGERLRYAGPEHRCSRDCSEGRNRATSRHRKLREMYLAAARRQSREWSDSYRIAIIRNTMTSPNKKAAETHTPVIYPSDT